VLIIFESDISGMYFSALMFIFKIQAVCLI